MKLRAIRSFNTQVLYPGARSVCTRGIQAGDILTHLGGDRVQISDQVMDIPELPGPEEGFLEIIEAGETVGVAPEVREALDVIQPAKEPAKTAVTPAPEPKKEEEKAATEPANEPDTDGDEAAAGDDKANDPDGDETKTDAEN